MKFAFAYKLEMSQIFSDEGRVIPVTKVKVLDDTKISALLSLEKQGYNALQIGARFDKKVKDKHLPKTIREIRVTDMSGYNVGDSLTISQFEKGDKVAITGTGKGKGFAGVIKRHGFHGANATHGTKHVERAGGSIGSRFPQHVLKGRKMPGRAGSKTVTVSKVEIVGVDEANNELFIKGPLPGARGSFLEILG